MVFDKSWENNKYSEIKKIDKFPYEKGNRYPYDLLVSIVAKFFFHIPKKNRKKIKVLDLGCGTANNAKFLAENGFGLYGIDGSETAIEISKEKFKNWNLKGNFIKGDFLHLPYENNFFDLVVDRESLYANRVEDIKKTIQEIYKKLKNNGLFVSFIYSSYHPDKKFGRMIEQNTFNNFKKESSFYQRGIVHFVNRKEIHEFYSPFRIKNITRHSLREISGEPLGSMEFDEYIIISKKKQK